MCPSPDLRDLIAVCPVFRAAFGLPALESAVLFGLTLTLTFGATVIGATLSVGFLRRIAS